MEFKFKCPVCNANNKITQTNFFCRRCKEDLSKLYEERKRRVSGVIFEVLRRQRKSIIPLN